MSLEDSLRDEIDQRRDRAAEAQAEEAHQGSLGVEVRRLLDEFYALMEAAGNPGLRTYTIEDAKGVRSFLRPKVRGWRAANDRLLTMDGRFFEGRRVGPGVGELHERVRLGRDAVEKFLGDIAYEKAHTTSPRGVSTVAHQLTQILADNGVRPRSNTG